MASYFIDDFLFITPFGHEPGIRLFGQVSGAHRAPLTLALLSCRTDHEDVTIDLTGVHHISQSALETLVGVSRSLYPPLRLILRARPELELYGRLAARGWHEMEGLHLSEVLWSPP
ncbi:hypothetical protein AB0B21_34800 [Streptomyces rimosus]|uniref:hypothetical protein n=1 Tax=Streptomyces TaxID=1883 RepID=UPI0005192470|nr:MULTISPECIES: hypothetical protein [Streptomyces]RSO03830.1 hypothetical protein DMH18_36215 [Streptomyces sp. WAC 06783]RSO40253.1 hypothetical protein DMH15_15470 [Streptomyces sp. WAC 06725]